MAGTLTPTPFQTVLDTDGVAVSGALIYTYVGGTTTAAATYTTSALSVANTNPIVADSAGRFVAYLPAGGNFKFTYKTAAGAAIEEQDNILSVPGAAVNLDIEGTVGEAVTAGQVCYLSTGAEATPLTAGLWYLTDADFAPTSTTCQSIGVAVSAIAINTAGTIRLAGTATTATAVVIGSTYYVSATAGAITATPPALSRTVGVALTTSTLLLAATTAVVTPAGSNTQVQFNDSGVLGGDSGFTFIKATDAVAIAGATTVGGTLGVTGATTLSSTVATGALTVTGAATVSSTLGVTGATTLSSTVATGALTITGAATYTTNLKSTTALATPSALTATQATAFASTVSGASIMGFGTTNDVSLMNRAGTVVLGVGPNTTAVNIPGTLAVTGAVTGGAYNSQTISSAASLTGTLATVGAITAGGTIQTLGTLQSSSGADLTLNANGVNRDVYLKVNGTTLLSAIGSTGGITVAGVLTVSGFGTHTFSAGGTGSNIIALRNTTDGTSMAAQLLLGNNASASAVALTTFAASYTTSSFNYASGTTLYIEGAGGLSIAAAHASGAIRFYSGGSTLRWSFNTAGTLLPDDSYDIGSASKLAGVLWFTASSSTGTTTIRTSDGALRPLTSSARYKEHMTPWVVSDEALKQFVALSPENWNYKDQQNGAAGFISERLHDLPIRNAYGTSPLINYDSEGRPDSNRDFALIGLQHLVLQQHDATITQLAARIAALETKDN